MLRLGIDLGGTNIAAGLVNEKGVIVNKKSIPTHAQRNPGFIIDDIVELCNSVCLDYASWDDVESVGIAVPGGVDVNSGMIFFTPNIPFTGLNISKILSDRLNGKKVLVINDANAALQAELVFGCATDSKNVVMITIGTGVGGGIAIDRHILNGINGMAAELGHMVIKKDGKACSCGRHGCFEAYASATALIELTKNEIDRCKRNDEYSLMMDAKEIDARVAFDAYKLGDPYAEKVITEYIESLASGVISLINIFQPELFVIGGGVSGEKQFLLDLLMPYVNKEQYSRSIDKNTRLATALCGNDAGIIGAAFAE